MSETSSAEEEDPVVADLLRSMNTRLQEQGPVENRLGTWNNPINLVSDSDDDLNMLALIKKYQPQDVSSADVPVARRTKKGKIVPFQQPSSEEVVKVKRQRKPKIPFEATPAVYHNGEREPRGRTINEFESRSASESSNTFDRGFIDNSKLKKPKVRKEGSELESSFGSNYTSNSGGASWSGGSDASFGRDYF